MNNFIISTDSASDVSAEIQLSMSLSVHPLLLTENGNSVSDRVVSAPELASLVARSADKKIVVSTTKRAFYEEFFDNLAEKNADILHVCQGSAFSSSYRNAHYAAKNTMVKFPKHSVYVVDSHATSAGLALIVDNAVMMRNKNVSPEEAFVGVNELAKKTEQYVIIGDAKNYAERFPSGMSELAVKSGSTALVSVNTAGNPVVTRRFSGAGTACGYVAKRYFGSGCLSPVYVYGSCDVNALLKVVSGLRKRGVTDIRMSTMGLANAVTFGKNAVYVAFFGQPDEAPKKKSFKAGKPEDFFEAQEE